MSYNIKFSRHKEIGGIGYIKYDNYNAIEVPFTAAIPSDYFASINTNNTKIFDKNDEAA